MYIYIITCRPQEVHNGQGLKVAIYSNEVRKGLNYMLTDVFQDVNHTVLSSKPTCTLITGWSLVMSDDIRT